VIAPRWRAVDLSLRWYERAGEPEAVAFSPLSGSIHLVTSSVRPLLEALSAAPRSLDELTALLAAFNLSAADAQAIVESLDRADLIEPVP
jgi:hypothetical protein